MSKLFFRDTTETNRNSVDVPHNVWDKPSKGEVDSSDQINWGRGLLCILALTLITAVFYYVYRCLSRASATPQARTRAQLRAVSQPDLHEIELMEISSARRHSVS